MTETLGILGFSLFFPCPSDLVPPTQIPTRPPHPLRQDSSVFRALIHMYVCPMLHSVPYITYIIPQALSKSSKIDLINFILQIEKLNPQSSNSLTFKVGPHDSFLWVKVLTFKGEAPPAAHHYFCMLTSPGHPPEAPRHSLHGAPFVWTEILFPEISVITTLFSRTSVDYTPGLSVILVTLSN